MPFIILLIHNLFNICQIMFFRVTGFGEVRETLLDKAIV